MKGKNIGIIICSGVILIVLTVWMKPQPLLVKVFHGTGRDTEGKGSNQPVNTGVLNTDWLCIPGQKVGPITYTTSEADLKRIFGAKNVSDYKPLVTAGAREVVLTVINEWRRNDLRIVWEDSRQKDKIALVDILGDTGAADWRTAEGITIGTPVKELNRINGEPFIFAGFGAADAGCVKSWGKGVLSQQKG